MACIAPENRTYNSNKRRGKALKFSAYEIHAFRIYYRKVRTATAIDILEKQFPAIDEEGTFTNYFSVENSAISVSSGASSSNISMSARGPPNIKFQQLIRFYNKQRRLSTSLKLLSAILQKHAGTRWELYLTAHYERFENKTHFQLRKKESDEILISGAITGEIANWTEFHNLEINSTQRVLRLLELATNSKVTDFADKIVKESKIEIADSEPEKIANYTSAISIDSDLIKYLNNLIVLKRTSGTEDIDIKDILDLHNFFIKNCLPFAQDKGRHICPLHQGYRNANEFTFDLGRGQIASWMPEWQDVPFLIKALIEWVNSEEAKKLNPIIVAGIFQYIFLKVHPFADGNGKTARTLAMLLLMSRASCDIPDFNLYLSELGQGLQSIGLRSTIFEWLKLFNTLTTYKSSISKPQSQTRQAKQTMKNYTKREPSPCIL